MNSMHNSDVQRNNGAKRDEDEHLLSFDGGNSTTPGATDEQSQTSSRVLESTGDATFNASESSELLEETGEARGRAMEFAESVDVDPSSDYGTNISVETSELNAAEAAVLAAEAAAEAAIASATSVMNMGSQDGMSTGSDATKTGWDIGLVALLEDMAEHPEYYVSAAGAVGGLALGGVVATSTLAAIATVPLLADSLRVIGLGYMFWFLNKYLLSSSRRKALAEDVSAVLRDARAPPAALLDKMRTNTLAEVRSARDDGTSQAKLQVGDK